jgi:CxxC-x17-CxxC domain-containing protein
MQFVDREITCLDCSQPFVFTAGEQEFYEKKGFREEPKRCKSCRDSRKTRRNDRVTEGLDRGNGQGNRAPAAHGDDDSIGNRRGGPPSRERGFRAPAHGPRDREMFDAVCAQCGTKTRVPFRPVAGRPVYCRDCFGARRGVGG